MTPPEQAEVPRGESLSRDCTDRVLVMKWCKEGEPHLPQRLECYSHTSRAEPELEHRQEKERRGRRQEKTDKTRRRRLMVTSVTKNLQKKYP